MDSTRKRGTGNGGVVTIPDIMRPRRRDKAISDGPPDLKPGLDRVSEIPVEWLRPSPENDELYQPASQGDPEIEAMAESMKREGVLDALVVTVDRYIVSGHRRRAAAKRARLKTVPCRVHPIRRADCDRDTYITLLREFNRQRVKSFDEVLREEAVSIDPTVAYQSLIDSRQKQYLKASGVEAMELPDRRKRDAISSAKVPFLDAIILAVKRQKQFWPISKRVIHYNLLNDPPLIHASKPASRYCNNLKSYKAMVELSTRAMLLGMIPWNAICDDTRLVETWAVAENVGAYIRQQFADFLDGYWRDLMRSQPYHVEIVGEKNTLKGIIHPVAAQYTIPYTLGRGFCSTKPRYEMQQRFVESGKRKMIVLCLSDHDPDGDTIAESFARSMRDDFHVDISAVRVALTAEQVVDLDLPADFEAAQAKTGSATFRKFIQRHGSADVYELEAVPGEKLQEILRDAIDSVIDVDLFNQELEREKEDAAQIAKVKEKIKRLLPSLVAPEAGQ